VSCLPRIYKVSAGVLFLTPTLSNSATSELPTQSIPARLTPEPAAKPYTLSAKRYPLGEINQMRMRPAAKNGNFEKFLLLSI